GTDHGHANAMFVLGNGVRGGKVYGQWPGLKSEQLYEGRDLALTTDFRDIFGEVAKKHLGTETLQANPGSEIFSAKESSNQPLPCRCSKRAAAFLLCARAETCVKTRNRKRK